MTLFFLFALAAIGGIAWVIHAVGKQGDRKPLHSSGVQDKQEPKPAPRPSTTWQERVAQIEAARNGASPVALIQSNPGELTRQETLRQRARAIRAANEARALAAREPSQAQVFDAEASQMRVQEAVQNDKTAAIAFAKESKQKIATPELSSGLFKKITETEKSERHVTSVGLSMEVFVDYGPTGPDIEKYTRFYLLSRFERGADIFSLENHPVYAHRLGTSPKHVLSDFLSDDLIRKFSATEALSHNLKIVDLKEMLKTHNYPVSGKKADLIQRVLELDDERVQQASVSPFFILSNKGRSMLEPFYRQERARHTAARREIEMALRDGDIGLALRVSERYNRLLMWGDAIAQNNAMGRSMLASILSSPFGNATERNQAAMMALLPQYPPGVPGG